MIGFNHNNGMRPLLWALLLLFVPLQSQGEEINTKQIVLGHIGDAYEWHMGTFGGWECTIPLPIIVHSPTSGWHCFSAARLREGAEYEGLRIAPEGEYAGKIKYVPAYETIVIGRD